MDKLEPISMEFHISRHARNLYQFDNMLFSLTGNAIFANFHAVRLFTQKINARRNLITYPEQAVRAGQINAMGLIDEILHLENVQPISNREVILEEMLVLWLANTNPAFAPYLELFDDSQLEKKTTY